MFDKLKIKYLGASEHHLVFYFRYPLFCNVVDYILLCPTQSILVPEASEFSQWEPEGVDPGCPVTAIIPMWKNLTTLDMSHNCISSIDSSVVRYMRTHTHTHIHKT